MRAAGYFLMLRGNRHSPNVPVRPFALAIGLEFVLCLAGIGCQTHYRKLVTPFHSYPVPPSVVEIGTRSIWKKKIGILHQPSVSAIEADRYAKAALREEPQAEFFSDYSINAVLYAYPSPRWPLFYCLEYQIAGMAARTNQTGASKSDPPAKPE